MSRRAACLTTSRLFVVDDDVSVRESLELMIRHQGWQAEIFASADEFLCRPRALVPHQALERSRVAHVQDAELQELRNCYSSLSLREQQVMALVVSGLLNKQVGGELGISEVTVKAHRGRVMQKMKADSLAELVEMAGRLRLTRTSKMG